MTTTAPGATAARRLTTEAAARLSELGYPHGSTHLALRLLLMTAPAVTDTSHKAPRGTAEHAARRLIAREV